MTIQELNASRPSDPSKISFSDECFEITGTETVWLVKAPLLAAGASWTEYKTEEEALKASRGAQVRSTTRSIRRRVRWN